MLSESVLPFVSFGLPKGVCAVLTVRFFGFFSCLIFALECGFLIAENGGAGQETVSWKVLLENGQFGVMRWFIAVSVLLCRWVESVSI